MFNSVLMLGRKAQSKLAEVTLDATTHALNIITYEHHEIHGGSSFTAYYNRTTANTAAGRTGLYIKTPAAASGVAHAVVTFAASAAAIYSICEAPTIASNTGTHTSLIRNRYRDSTATSGCFNNAATPAAGKYTTLTEAQIAGDGTWATGTVLRTNPVAAGVGPRAAGGDSRDTQEWLLKSGTAYVFLLTNDGAPGAAGNKHYITVDWYEHTDKTNEGD